MRVFLFDLDGVLIRPGGYRAAFRATVRHIAERLGFDPESSTLDDSVMDAFESCGLTSEWETTPICLAAMVFEAWRLGIDVSLPNGHTDGHPPASELCRLADPLDFPGLARRVAAAWGPEELPSAAALRLFLSDAASHAHGNGRLPGLSRTLSTLLADTRSMPASPTTFVFQHYALGSRAFEATYGIPSVIETESYIQLHDRPGITPPLRDRVLALAEAGALFPVIYTLRPSEAPRELEDRPIGFSPEAELAVRLVGMQGLPLMGLGRVSWLESRHKARPDAFGKPSPVHALAAVLAALTRNERESLDRAHALFVGAKLDPGLETLGGQPLEVHVFEDSPSGVRGAREAVSILRQAGLDARLHAWGITTTHAKAQALLTLGARLFPNVDAAIETALSSNPGE